jgi:hypothetical protein
MSKTHLHVVDTDERLAATRYRTDVLASRIFVVHADMSVLKVRGPASATVGEKKTASSTHHVAQSAVNFPARRTSVRSTFVGSIACSSIAALPRSTESAVWIRRIRLPIRRRRASRRSGRRIYSPIALPVSTYRNRIRWHRRVRLR